MKNRSAVRRTGRRFQPNNMSPEERQLLDKLTQKWAEVCKQQIATTRTLVATTKHLAALKPDERLECLQEMSERLGAILSSEILELTKSEE